MDSSQPQIPNEMHMSHWKMIPLSILNPSPRLIILLVFFMPTSLNSLLTTCDPKKYVANGPAARFMHVFLGLRLQPCSVPASYQEGIISSWKSICPSNQ